MRHEKIIKRPDGSRVEITAILYVDYSNNLLWSISSRYSPPGKRKFYPAGPGYGFPGATPEELLQTRLELWEKIKPE